MAHIYLIEGPVGAGKSTFATQLRIRHPAPRLNLDDWMVTLFRPDRPAVGMRDWYVARKARCIEQIWKVTRELMASNTSVILELGLLYQQSRLEFYERMELEGYSFTVFVLDASRDTRRERVRARNRQKGETFSMEVPDQIFELASDQWESVDELECMGRDIRFVSTEDGMG